MTWPTKTDFVDGDVLTAAQVNNIGTNLNEADPTGITDGYVLTADGAGSMGWEAAPSGGWTLIATGAMSGASAVSSGTFSGYKQVKAVFQAFVVSSARECYLAINGGAVSVRYSIIEQTGSTSVNCDVGSSTNGRLQLSTVTAGNTATYELDFFNVDTALTMKPWRSQRQVNQTSYNSAIAWGGILTASAITEITFQIFTATFTNGTYYFYGLA
jgi:hypothetical protein